MFTINRSKFILLSILVVVAMVLSFLDVCYGQKKDQKKKEETYVMNEAELQAHLMSFADRFAAYISQGFETFDELTPSLESRRIVQGDAVYSMYAAFLTLRCWIWW
jgi:hypothetical protein